MRDPFNSDHYLDIDFDTSYDDTELWQGALKSDGDSDHVATERRGNLSRVRFFYIITAVVVSLLGGRLLVLQIVNSDQNKALAEGNRVREAAIPAPRGVIYDAKRNLVARNVANFEALVTPSELPKNEEERQAIYNTLAGLVKKPVDEVKKISEEKGLRYAQEILLADQLATESSTLLKVKETELPGIHVRDNPQRQYANAPEYAHLIGYTGRVSEDDLKRNPDLKTADYLGKSGLESFFEDELSGTSGQRRVEVNASGQAVKELQSSEPAPGSSLQLSIDPDLQKSMYKAVGQGIESSKRDATGASAIALNPKNGEILGMVSLPSFDNNQFVNGIDEGAYRQLADDRRKPLFNRPISGEYPPGSTFKIVTATGALAEGVVGPNTFLSSPPELNIDGFRFPDWKPEGHGNVSVVGALAESSDVYFYKVAGGLGEQKGLGERKLGDYMRQYNIGNKSGIDLPLEKTGLVPTPEYKEETAGEPWYIGNTYQMGIGQGFVLTTPLQVANYTAAIAGNGVAYKPHVVRATENADNPSDVKPVTPEQLINLKVDPSVIKSVQQGMQQAVAVGTARDLADMPVEVCGKTGSAEFANETNAHAWFTAYAPCNDPQIVITVMIEGGGEGSDVAVPAAKSILSDYFKVPNTSSPQAAEKSTDAPGRIKTSD